MTILDQSLRIRQVKAQSINRADCVSAITKTRDLPEWFVSADWTEYCLLTDVLVNITFEGVKGKGREIMSGFFAWLRPHYLLPIASVVDFPANGNSNHVFGPTKRKPLKANRQPIHRDNLEKYPDGSRPVSENTITSLIRINGLPLARGRIQQGMDLIGKMDGILEDALSEINTRENRNTGTEGKAKAGCMAAINPIRNSFLLLPCQQGKSEYSQFRSFVATGSSLEIILSLYDLTYNLLTERTPPNHWRV